KEQVDAIDSAIAEETARISSTRTQQYREALEREQKLKAEVAGLKQELDTQNRANIQYANFQREADTNRELYDALLQRYKEIGVAGTVGINNIAVVEPAIAPDKPSSPVLIINLAISLLLGFGLAGATAFALEQIDEGVREPGQVEALLKLPLLGITPQVEQDDVFEELQDIKSNYYDAYFSIRSSLAFSTNHGFPKSLAVTSTRPGEGKSSSAMALATVLGRTGKRVLLVDADLRSPSIHAFFEKTNEKFDKALDKFMDFTNAGSSPFRLNKPSTPKPSAPALNKPGGSGGNLKPVANGGEGTPGLVVNPMLTSSSPQSEASSVGPAGNDSLPTYDPVDPSNPYIMYVMKEFGIMAGV
ncbi:MAG: hypothetical protein EBZ26_10350, partial [Flavobacteriia bacterium]|nr:hypothetical protein [Flavobacteriia bacterium]